MRPQSLAWPVSVDLGMSGDGPFRTRVPLTAAEEARRAAALKANRDTGRPMADMLSPEPMVEVAAVTSGAGQEAKDERSFGPRTAQMLRKCQGDVALAPNDRKKDVFKEVGKRLGEEVSGGWLSKAAMVDRLLEIAEVHNRFGLNPDQIQQLIADAAKAIRIPQTAAVSAPLVRRLITRRASDVQIEKLIWVWPGRIPMGKLVLIGGPPGLGKSQLTTFMSAVISNGWDWPCNEGSATAGNVIFMSAEDGIEDTIAPRLKAAGANLDSIYIVAAATKPDGTGRKTFSLKTDVDLLEAKAKEIGDVRLIVIDPISAYMGGSDGNGNVETREVLEPVAEMANRLHIAVVAVTHLNKGGGGGSQNALNRFAGSIAFIAAARAAFAVIEDPEHEGRRLLLQVKNNLGPPCKGLAFRMEQRLVSEGIVSSSVTFDGEHVSQSVDQALAASENPRGDGSQTSGKDDIAEFLTEVLAAGPVDVLEVERQARLAGLLGESKRIRESKSFRLARTHLGVLYKHEGFGPGSRYLLSLPGAPCAPQKPMGAHSREGAPMQNLGAHDGLEGLAPPASPESSEARPAAMKPEETTQPQL
jgi:putative DNA primase/helicase